METTKAIRKFRQDRCMECSMPDTLQCDGDHNRVIGCMDKEPGLIEHREIANYIRDVCGFCHVGKIGACSQRDKVVLACMKVDTVFNEVSYRDEELRDKLCREKIKIY